MILVLALRFIAGTSADPTRNRLWQGSLSGARAKVRLPGRYQRQGSTLTGRSLFIGQAESALGSNLREDVGGGYVRA